MVYNQEPRIPITGNDRKPPSAFGGRQLLHQACYGLAPGGRLSALEDAAYYTIFRYGIARENVIPPLKYEPLTEAIKKVAIHQADGYSPLTPYIIPYFRANVLVKIEMVEPDKLPRHGTREQSDSTNSVAAAVPLPRNPTVKNRTPHIIPYFATGLQGGKSK